MSQPSLDAFVRGLKIIIEAENRKMKPLSEAAGMGESGVRDLFRYGSAPRVSNAYALSQQLGRSVDEIIAIGTAGAIPSREAAPSVPVLGHVGAGAHVPLVDAHEATGGMFRVAAPAQLMRRGQAAQFAAVEVQGDSMAPQYQPGDILFYCRATHEGILDEDIGRACVVAGDDGNAWVKQVKRGDEPGLFHLISLNPTGENMHNRHIKWASRVILALSEDMIERI